MIKKYQLFKNQIIYLIQNSGLDIGMIYFILKDIMTEIDELYCNQIKLELTIEQEKKEEE